MEEFIKTNAEDAEEEEEEEEEREEDSGGACARPFFAPACWPGHGGSAWVCVGRCCQACWERVVEAFCGWLHIVMYVCVCVCVCVCVYGCSVYMYIYMYLCVHMHIHIRGRLNGGRLQLWTCMRGNRSLLNPSQTIPRANIPGRRARNALQ